MHGEQPHCALTVGKTNSGKTKWCLDDTPPTPGETYNETPNPPITVPPPSPPVRRPGEGETWKPRRLPDYVAPPPLIEAPENRAKARSSSPTPQQLNSLSPLNHHISSSSLHRPFFFSSLFNFNISGFRREKIPLL